MFIQSNAADFGLQRSHRIRAYVAIRIQHIPYQIQIVAIILFGFMLLIAITLTVARTTAIPKIIAPPLSYLPGNPLPQLPKDAGCVDDEALYPSCFIHVEGQTVFVHYDPTSRMIVHTGFKIDGVSIGNLIVAWSVPTGINQYSGRVFVYWGKRRAVLYTDSFRPESPVEFIHYEMQEHDASPWQGFANAKTKQ